MTFEQMLDKGKAMTATEAGLLHLDFDQVAQLVDAHNLSEAEEHRYWCALIEHWLSQLGDQLKGHVRFFETDNFFLLSAREAQETELISNFVETCYKKTQISLKGIVDGQPIGKQVVICMGDPDQYYRYVSKYYPDDGEFAGSAGVFLKCEYGHIVIAPGDYDNCEFTLAHELTHALVSHLSLPRWLDEAIAVSNEHSLLGLKPIYGDSKLKTDAVEYWQKNGLQEFWTGEAFFDPVAGNHSYLLAELLLTKIMGTSPHKAVAFVNQAEFEDGGEEACQTAFGHSLGVFAGSVLGAGDWNPQLEDGTP